MKLLYLWFIKKKMHFWGVKTWEAPCHYTHCLLVQVFLIKKVWDDTLVTLLTLIVVYTNNAISHLMLCEAALPSLFPGFPDPLHNVWAAVIQGKYCYNMIHSLIPKCTDNAITEVHSFTLSLLLWLVTCASVFQFTCHCTRSLLQRN